MEHHPLILSAKDVNIQFDLRGKILHAIRGIDLDLYQGEVLAIVGESGSGKSVFTSSFRPLAGRHRDPYQPHADDRSLLAIYK